MEQKIIKLLRYTFVSIVLTAVLLVVIYEAGLLLPGDLAADGQAIYAMEMVGVGLTIVSIPLALKWMTFGWVRNALAEGPEKYLLHALLRQTMLSVPLLYDTLTYYLLGSDPTMGYLGLMTLVAMLFVWPSRGRMEYETRQDYRNDEK